MRRHDLVAAVATAAVIGWIGCGEEQPSVEPEAPVATEEQERQQLTERRNKESAALGERGAELERAIAELQAAAGPSEAPLPESVARPVAELEAHRAELESLLPALREADAEGWEQARDRLQAKLDEARAAHDGAAAQLSEWRAREQEALTRRTPLRLPIDEETGLIAGLDGGEYPHYHVYRIERAQRRLRELGLYAGPVDGYLDEVTMAAVGGFQEQNGLHVSGVPSPMTRARLFVAAPDLNR